MKKLLLSLAAFSLLLSACDNTPKYTIDGTIQGDQTGNILLVKENGNQLDTIGKAAIKNGKFKITGHVDSLTIAYASVEGSRYYIPVFLEMQIIQLRSTPPIPWTTKSKELKIKQ